MSDDILCPTNVEELRDLVEVSFASNSSLLVKGEGSKDGWGQPGENSQKVGVSGISGITLYEPEELVMTAAAGTSTFDEYNTQVGIINQSRLPDFRLAKAYKLAIFTSDGNF